MSRKKKKKKKISAEEKRRDDHSRLSVEYNLEKEPLQSGRTEPPVSLRTRVAMAAKQWTLRRRMAGWLVVWFLFLVLVVSGLASWMMSFMTDSPGAD